MGKYVVRRLIEAVPVILLASILVFALLHLIPGDPAGVILGSDATPAQVATLREQLGLNRPILVQLGSWWWSLLHGNLGTSYRIDRPVTDLIRLAAIPTLQLAGVSYAITLLVGVTFGTLAGVYTRSIWDWGVSLSTVAFIAVPHFVFGIVALWIVGLKLGWLPIGGYVPLWQDPAMGLKTIALPALTLGLAQAAILGRYTRTSVSQVMNQQYITTARSKGLQERVVIMKHALRNALVPVITVAGLQVAQILAGAVVIEQVFSRPGLGRLVVHSIESRDVPTVQGVLLVLVLIFILVNLVADLLYGVVDPRIRYD
jgi:peptide/nickel transport system permease protein